jgi:putative molybdopterin biosynthesis protein
MRHIQLSYEWQAERLSEARIHNDFIELLLAVRTQGSISKAAARLGYSYRHTWGALKRWEATIGQALIVWDQGHAARLTPFADKLLWTERLAQARLAPQIDALRAELERTLSLAFDPQAHVLSLYASHDEALPRLQTHAAQTARLHLDIRFCGSVDAIRALNEGRCALAGFHAREQASADSLFAQAYKPLLKPGLHKIIGFARRTQGLMVAAGNPLRIDSLKRIAHWRLRFVNRSPGAGTRVLLDELLREQGLAAEQLVGYEHGEPSHSAVALAVASGRADAGLGTEAAARAQGLDFVPLVTEHYHLVCLKSALDQPPVVALRDLLAQPAWHRQVGGLPGYQPLACGQVQSLRAVLPWWTFGRKRTPSADQNASRSASR